MKFETQKEFPLIPIGEHVLKLASCDTQEFDDRFGNTGGKVERIKWRFVSNETDDDGTPYDFVVYTGKSYGDPRAGFTRLIDMLVPGITEKDIADFDSDDLLGKRFQAQIKHVKKDDGKIKADYTYMRPFVKGAAANGGVKPAAKPAPAASDGSDDIENMDDPFADGPESGEYRKAA